MDWAGEDLVAGATPDVDTPRAWYTYWRDLLDSEGEPKQAAEYYEEAIKLLESTDEHDLAQATYSALSRLRLKQGNWVGAINAFESGLAQAERPNVVMRVVRKILSVPRKMIGGG